MSTQTDQRDLAAEVEDIRKGHSSTVIRGWGGEDVDTLLAYIGLQREALHWCLENGVLQSQGFLWFHKSLTDTIQPPSHLRAVLEQALGSKA